VSPCALNFLKPIIFVDPGKLRIRSEEQRKVSKRFPVSLDCNIISFTANGFPLYLLMLIGKGKAGEKRTGN